MKAILTAIAWIAVMVWAVVRLIWWFVAEQGSRRARRYRLPPGPVHLHRRLWHRQPAGRQRMGPAEVRAKRWALGRRDGWHCQQCDLLLDASLHWSDWRYPQVHHLFAWSLGGSDELWNLCLLCARCNRAIGTGTTRRLRRLARQLRESQPWWRRRHIERRAA